MAETLIGKDKPKQKDNRPRKHDSVTILEFNVTVVPVNTPMGQGIGQVVWGIGDDNKMYQWSSDDSDWKLS